ncbi:unnamed protein product, partial [Linum tenue]
MGLRNGVVEKRWLSNDTAGTSEFPRYPLRFSCFVCRKKITN